MGTQTHLHAKFSFSSDFGHFISKMLGNAKFSNVSSRDAEPEPESEPEPPEPTHFGQSRSRRRSRKKGGGSGSEKGYNCGK